MEALVAQARKTPAATNSELAKVLSVSSSRISQLLTEGRKTGRLSRRDGTLIVGNTTGKSAGTQRGKKSSRKRTTTRSRGTRERAS